MTFKFGQTISLPAGTDYGNPVGYQNGLPITATPILTGQLATRFHCLVENVGSVVVNISLQDQLGNSKSNCLNISLQPNSIKYLDYIPPSISYLQGYAASQQNINIQIWESAVGINPDNTLLAQLLVDLAALIAAIKKTYPPFTQESPPPLNDVLQVGV